MRDKICDLIYCELPATPRYGGHQV